MTVFSSDLETGKLSSLELLWQGKTHSYVTAQPLESDGYLFVSDYKGYIYCFEADTGKKRFEKRLYQTPKRNSILGNIPLLKKFLSEPLPYMWCGFAGTGCISDGIWYLLSVGGKPGGPLSNGSPGKLYAINCKTGALLWEKPLSTPVYSGSLAVPTFDEKNLYTAVCSVEEIATLVHRLFIRPYKPNCVGEIFCFDKKTGEKRWNKRVTEFSPESPKNPLNAKGAGIWGGLYLSHNKQSLFTAAGNNYGGPASEFSDSILCLDPLNGNLKWSYQAVADDKWLPLKPDGPDYDFGCTPIPFPCPLASNGYAVGAGNKNGYVYALDERKGTVLWVTNAHVSSAPDDGIRSNITYYNGNLFVWSKNKTPKDSMSVNCINAKDGKVIWNKIYHGTNAMTTGAITNGLYFLSNYSGELYALDTTNGKQLWKTTLKNHSFGSNLAIYHNCIYSGFGVPLLYGGDNSNFGVACYGIRERKYF